MQTVAETQHYAKLAAKLLTCAEREEVITTIAADPTVGDIIQGTGGIRKLRIAKEGRGKSGSLRVIYYFYNPDFPIHLLTLFGKNEKANLSAAEKASLAKAVNMLKQHYREKKDGKKSI